MVKVKYVLWYQNKSILMNWLDSYLLFVSCPSLVSFTWIWLVVIHWSHMFQKSVAETWSDNPSEMTERAWTDLLLHYQLKSSLPKQTQMVLMFLKPKMKILYALRAHLITIFDSLQQFKHLFGVSPPGQNSLFISGKGFGAILDETIWLFLNSY